MSSSAIPSQINLLKAKVKLPQHVVYRTFPTETVVLNLQTGKYHGLNPTAGRMLETLERAESVLEAATVAAGEYEQPQATTERDMCSLCSSLLERDLIEIEEGDDGG
ncbi:MAG TPA: PqqD family protein [Solirubrobacterales bacterium]